MNKEDTLIRAFLSNLDNETKDLSRENKNSILKKFHKELSNFVAESVQNGEEQYFVPDAGWQGLEKTVDLRNANLNFELFEHLQKKVEKGKTIHVKNPNDQCKEDFNGDINSIIQLPSTPAMKLYLVSRVDANIPHYLQGMYPIKSWVLAETPERAEELAKEEIPGLFERLGENGIKLEEIPLTQERFLGST